MKQNNKYVIGLIGGAGSGKTFVGKHIAQKLDGLFIEADKVGHIVINKSYIIQNIVDIFGKRVLNNGKIDRRALGSIVFNDEDKRLELNKIMHLAMFDEIDSMIKSASEQVIILEAAVMIEAGFNRLVDKMILITASEQVKLDRLIRLRGIEQDKAISLLGLLRDDLETYADHIYDTSDGLEPLEVQIDSMVITVEEALNETLI